jgi:hypothetical protein
MLALALSRYGGIRTIDYEELAGITGRLVGGLEALREVLRNYEALRDFVGSSAPGREMLKVSLPLRQALENLKVFDLDHPLLSRLSALDRVSEIQSKIDAIPNLKDAIERLEKLAIAEGVSEEIQAARRKLRSKQLENWKEIE